MVESAKEELVGSDPGLDTSERVARDKACSISSRPIDGGSTGDDGGAFGTIVGRLPRGGPERVSSAEDGGGNLLPDILKVMSMSSFEDRNWP